MGQHFNAFISYRHKPLDIRIASEIQTQLERMRIPRTLQKKLGKKRIDRIFRDREELPITCNINEDIAEAIVNSEYLIVICSPDTRESVWVLREIQLFLQTHDRQHVLTVLAAGEPKEVIPEILLREERTDPVTGETKTVLYEPLSCDYRIGLHKARREELPRLAAPLIGCSYDDLRQRQRQYRAHRTIAILSAGFALASALAIFAVRTSLVVQNSYEQTLRSQSRYLANEALNAYQGGNQLTALSLALAALPSKQNDRPWIPEAEAVLTQITNAYNENSTLVSVASIGISDDSTCILSNNDRYLCTCNSSTNVLQFWDMGTICCVGEATYSNEIGISLRPIGEKYALAFDYMDDNTVWLLDCSTGEEVWKITLSEPENLERWSLAVPENGMVFAAVCSDTVLFVNGEDGSLLKRVPIDSGLGEILSVNAYALSDNGRWLAGCFFLQNDTTEPMQPANRYPFLLDMETGAFHDFPASTDYIRKMRVNDEGEFYTVELEGDGKDSELFITNNIIYQTSVCDYYFTGIDTVLFRKYSAASGDMLWETPVSFCNTYYEEVVCDRGDGTLLCAVSDVVLWMDDQTGEILAQCETMAPVLSAKLSNAGRLHMVLQNGMIGNYSPEENNCVAIPYLADKLRSAEHATDPDTGSDSFFARQANNVLYYRWSKMSPHWKQLGPKLEYGYSSNVSSCGDYTLVSGYSGQACVLDSAEDRILWRQDEKDEEMNWSWRAVGFVNDGKNIVYATQYHNTIQIQDTLTGERHQQEANTFFDYSFSNCTPLILNDAVLYTLDGYDGGVCRNFLIRYHTENWEYDWMELPEGDIGTEELFSDGKKVLIRTREQGSIMADMETGDCIQLDLLPERVWWDADSSFVAALENSLVKCDAAGAPLWTVTLDGCAEGLCFAPELDCILVACNDGTLLRLSDDGRLLGSTDIEMNKITYGTVMDFTFDGKGRLIVNYNKMANVIDLSSWKLLACVKNCLHYDLENDKFIVNCDEGLGYFTRYSTEDLIALGRDILGDYTLSEDLRAAYGLD